LFFISIIYLFPCFTSIKAGGHGQYYSFPDQGISSWCNTVRFNEAPHTAPCWEICDVLPFAIARIKKIELQIGPSTTNLNQSFTCFRVTLVDFKTSVRQRMKTSMQGTHLRPGNTCTDVSITHSIDDSDDSDIFVYHLPDLFILKYKLSNVRFVIC